MDKTLVAYFSASGVTARLAKKLAQVIGADLYEIRPSQPYSQADLDWTDENSRSSLEMKDRTFRPSVDGKLENMEEYDRIFLGFPIWWYVAPTIINTFLEQYALTGKIIVPFATSGSSGMGKTEQGLTGSCKGAVLKKGKRFEADAGADELKRWAESY